MAVTVEDIRAVLAETQDPALKVDFVSAGMVSSVALEGDRAVIGIELTTPACPSRDVIARSIEAAVGKLPGVTGVDVRFTAKVLGRPNHPSNPRLPGPLALGRARGLGARQRA